MTRRHPQLVELCNANLCYEEGFVLGYPQLLNVVLKYRSGTFSWSYWMHNNDAFCCYNTAEIFSICTQEQIVRESGLKIICVCLTRVEWTLIKNWDILWIRRKKWVWKDVMEITDEVISDLKLEWLRIKYLILQRQVSTKDITQ